MLSSIRRILARIAAVFHSRDLDNELAEELDAHIGLRTRDLIRRGMTPEAAERTARIELGGVTQLRETHRALRGLPFLDILSQDLRYIRRALAKTPGFTSVAVATLALGIGLTIVVFTAYAAIQFSPLHARAPEEIVRLQWRGADRDSDQFSWSEYERFSDAAHLLAPVFATSTPQTIICKLSAPLGGHDEVVRVRFVSPNYFAALGITPEIGRPLGAGEGDSVVVSHDFWKTKLGADTSVYGKTLGFERGALPIAAVAPERFAGTGAPPQTPDMWIPASAQSLVMPGIDWIHGDNVREWQVLAREKPALRSQAAAELATLSSHWPRVADLPIQLSASRAMFYPANTGAFQTFIEVCAILMVAVCLVLLIGCVNLTHLIAARNSGREQEFALRLAIGASRSRLVRQLCTESIVLGLLGGGLGFVLSYWSCRWLALKSLELISQIGHGAIGISLDVSPDWRVFCWTAAVSLITGIGVGILPAVRASNRDINCTLKQGAVGAVGASGAQRSRGLLLAVQIAGCLVLLSGAGLLFRGAFRAEHIGAQFDYKHLAVVGIDTRGAAQAAGERINVLRQALQRMKSISAIESVAWADRVPFLGTGAGIFQNEQGASLGCIFNGVSDEYFAAVGIGLVAGRTFRREEIDKEPSIAVISEATARRLWPGQNAVGRRISAGTTWLRSIVGYQSFTVVGVVKSIRSTYLSKDDEGYVYLPRRLHDGGMLFLVRTRTLPERTFPALAMSLAGINPDLQARSFMSSMTQGPVRIQELMAQAPATVALVLGGLALLLACIGIYGVVSQFVARRTREIGIRVALGASTWNVIATVSGHTLRPVSWGAAAGLIGSFGISGFLHALVVMPDLPDLTYGAGAFDPLTFICVLTVLAIVVASAAFAPVWRATRVDAAVALRNE